MLRESVTIDDAVAFLNDALRADPAAISCLIQNRVPCSGEMLAHPTIQCGEREVGFLGLLNGLFGTYPDGPRAGWGPISAVYTAGAPQFTISRFERTDRLPGDVRR